MEKKQYTIEVKTDAGAPALFGLAELKQALAQAGWTEGEGAVITLGLNGGGSPDSYTITRPGAARFALTGADPRGLMYACLDLAEQLLLNPDLDAAVEKKTSPELLTRGLHTFLHHPESEKDWLYDPAYWQSYADSLAWNRYNRFNLIYGHQSPHLIPIYTFMLDDLDAEFPEIKIRDLQPGERAKNLAALQAASSAMASRGIDFFLGIWNSRPWQIKHGVWETQPTRVDGTDDLGMLTTYTRKGFVRLMELCPDIKGIQLRMNIESGIADQRFFVQAFVPALKELRAKGREIKVELRNWGLHPNTIEAFRQSGADIVVSTKYFAEHQGMPYQPPITRGSYSYDSFLRKDKPFPFQWHVWNLGSHRLFNWGDPDYARRFALSCHLGDGVGFEITPPASQKGYSQWGYVNPGDWSERTDLPRRWDFDRYWFFNMAFGRMSYDIHTPEAVFLHQIAQRTTPQAAPLVYEAYRAASQVISYLISQRMDDPNMYVWPELDAGGTIDHNTIAPPGEESLFATAREYASGLVHQQTGAKRSPFDCAADLDGFAAAIDAPLRSLAGMPGLEDSVEYRTIKVDFAAIAALSRYQAAKSRATGYLSLFYASGERTFLDQAETEARLGINLWDALCAETQVFYEKLHYGPSGGHWKDNKPRVAYDLRRILRVREIFDAYGLFIQGFDFGPTPYAPQAARFQTGMEPEPRFTRIDLQSAYSPQQGFGWTKTAGLRPIGFGPLPHQLIWGVHHIQPGKEYDPAAVETMPLDGLTQRYLMSETPHTFQVDLANGEYEVAFILPQAYRTSTLVSVNGKRVDAAGEAEAVKTFARVVDGKLLVKMGGEGPWALAGLSIRQRAPQIAHLVKPGVHAETDLTITATATAPDGIRSMKLSYLNGGHWVDTPMTGDGTAFTGVIPAAALSGPQIEYTLTAEDNQTHSVRKEGLRSEVVRGFQAPRVVQARGPATWSPTQEMVFEVDLANGEFASELILHYREADQNRNFRSAALAAGESKTYVFKVDPRHLDGDYEVIYYFEVRDRLGSGSFYPDPFTDARYRIIK